MNAVNPVLSGHCDGQPTCEEGLIRCGNWTYHEKPPILSFLHKKRWPTYHRFDCTSFLILYMFCIKYIWELLSSHMYHHNQQSIKNADLLQIWSTYKVTLTLWEILPSQTAKITLWFLFITGNWWYFIGQVPTNINNSRHFPGKNYHFSFQNSGISQSYSTVLLNWHQICCS